MRKILQLRFLLLFLVLLICALCARDFLAQRAEEALFPSDGLSEATRLSHWFPELRDTRSDSRVFIYDSGQAGGCLLVLGGTHANEPASNITAALILENLHVSQGKVIVLPNTNASAFTLTEPQEAHPAFFYLEARDGSQRRFRMGSRMTNPLDQWPDPEITVHHPSGQQLAGNEVRNLNRCYPGREQGTRTEQVAYAICRLIEEEAVDMVVDLHESSPEYPVINAIVTHERAADLAATATFGLEFSGLKYALEPSPKNLHGLSHRELGDAFPGIYALLMESANPSQGRLRGRTDAELVVSGKDECYVRAQAAGYNKAPVPEDGIPMRRRVGRHLAGLQELCNALAMLQPEKTILLEGLPGFDELQEKGLAPWLAPAPADG